MEEQLKQLDKFVDTREKLKSLVGNESEIGKSHILSLNRIMGDFSNTTIVTKKDATNNEIILAGLESSDEILLRFWEWLKRLIDGGETTNANRDEYEKAKIEEQLSVIDRGLEYLEDMDVELSAVRYPEKKLLRWTKQNSAILHAYDYDPSKQTIVDIIEEANDWHVPKIWKQIGEYIKGRELEKLKLSQNDTNGLDKFWVERESYFKSRAPINQVKGKMISFDVVNLSGFNVTMLVVSERNGKIEFLLCTCPIVKEKINKFLLPKKALGFESLDKMSNSILRYKDEDKDVIDKVIDAIEEQMRLAKTNKIKSSKVKNFGILFNISMKARQTINVSITSKHRFLSDYVNTTANLVESVVALNKGN